jgi:hypothetical protein
MAGWKPVQESGPWILIYFIFDLYFVSVMNLPSKKNITYSVISNICINFFVYFFGGLECVGRSFVGGQNVDNLLAIPLDF